MSFFFPPQQFESSPEQRETFPLLFPALLQVLLGQVSRAGSIPAQGALPGWQTLPGNYLGIIAPESLGSGLCQGNAITNSQLIQGLIQGIHLHFSTPLSRRIPSESAAVFPCTKRSYSRLNFAVRVGGSPPKDFSHGHEDSGRKHNMDAAEPKFLWIPMEL